MTEIAGAKPGDVIAGNLRVERVIGSGGMGVVVEATHLTLNKPVAVKILLPDFAQNSEVLARFIQEARAAVKIRDEHIVHVTDIGTLESGAPFIVMELLQGTDLGDLLAAQGPLPVQAACEYVLDACKALARAHASGFIHRDMKPQNLFLTRRVDGSPIIKVLDFGISKALTPEPSAAITRTGTALGTPNYMSPEQMLAPSTVDARTDIWSLGVVLYELVSNRVPFVAPSVSRLWMEITRQDPIPLRQVAPHVPLEFEEIVLRCLAKAPAHRFASVGELAAALEGFLRAARSGALRPAPVDGVAVAPSRGVPATPRNAQLEFDKTVPVVAAPDVQPTLSREEEQQPLERPPAVGRARRTVAIFATAAALSALTFGGVTLYRDRVLRTRAPEDPPEMAPTATVATLSPSATPIPNVPAKEASAPDSAALSAQPSASASSSTSTAPSSAPALRLPRPPSPSPSSSLSSPSPPSSSGAAPRSTASSRAPTGDPTSTTQ